MYSLTRTEEEILLTIWELKEDAYLVAIRRQLNMITEKELTIGAIHIPLSKFEKSGIVESNFGEATPKRGGRRKRIYKLTKAGVELLKKHKEIRDRVWSGFNQSYSRSR